MVLSKGGLFYRLAYGGMRENKRPERSDLCRFFGRLLLWTLVVWPLMWLSSGVFHLVFFLGGGYTDSKNIWSEGSQVHWLPFLPRIKGYPILPVYITFPAFLLLINLLAESEVALAVDIFTGLIAFAGLCFLGVYKVERWSKRPNQWEVFKLVGGLFRSLKERTCVLIRFV